MGHCCCLCHGLYSKGHSLETKRTHTSHGPSPAGCSPILGLALPRSVGSRWPPSVSIVYFLRQPILPRLQEGNPIPLPPAADYALQSCRVCQLLTVGKNLVVPSRVYGGKITPYQTYHGHIPVPVGHRPTNCSSSQTETTPQRPPAPLLGLRRHLMTFLVFGLLEEGFCVCLSKGC